MQPIEWSWMGLGFPPLAGWLRAVFGCQGGVEVMLAAWCCQQSSPRRAEEMGLALCSWPDSEAQAAGTCQPWSGVLEGEQSLGRRELKRTTG